MSTSELGAGSVGSSEGGSAVGLSRQVESAGVTSGGGPVGAALSGSSAKVELD